MQRKPYTPYSYTRRSPTKVGFPTQQAQIELPAELLRHLLCITALCPAQIHCLNLQSKALVQQLVSESLKTPERQTPAGVNQSFPNTDASQS